MHELPKLLYEYNALEPHFDARTMEIHHSKHHAGYTKKLNTALEKLPDMQDMSAQELMARLSEISDEKLQTAVRNNGGGYVNHSLFWEILSPNGGDKSLSGDLEKALETEFGSVEEFRTKFSDVAGTRFGSGWAWLAVDADKKFKVMSTPNQDNPWMEGLTPILALDVWEHAYYLNYQNRRPDYIKAFWNVVNWDKVGELYTSAVK